MSKRINKNPKLSSFIILTFVLMISLFTNINSVKAGDIIHYIRTLKYTEDGIYINGWAYETGANRVGGTNNNIKIRVINGSKSKEFTIGEYSFKNKETGDTYKSQYITSDHTAIACWKNDKNKCNGSEESGKMYGLYNVEFEITISYEDLICDELGTTKNGTSYDLTFKIIVNSQSTGLAVTSANITDTNVTKTYNDIEYTISTNTEESSIIKKVGTIRQAVVIRESTYTPIYVTDEGGEDHQIYTVDYSTTIDLKYTIIGYAQPTVSNLGYAYSGDYGTTNVDIKKWDSKTSSDKEITKQKVDMIKIKYGDPTSEGECYAKKYGTNRCRGITGTLNVGYIPITHVNLSGTFKLTLKAKATEKCKVTLGTIKYNHSNDNASDSLNNCTNNSTPSTAKINLTSIEIPLKVIADGESCSAAGTTKTITIKNSDDNPLLTISQEVKMNVTQGTTITNGTAYDLYFNYQNLITLDKTNLYKEILGSNKDTNIDAIDDMIASFKYSGTSEQIPAASGVSGTKILEKIVSKVPTLYKYNSQALISGSDKLSLSTMDSNNSNNPHSSQSENMTFIHYKKYNGVTWSTWNDSSTDNGTTYEPYEQDGYTLGTASNLFSKSILEDTTYNTTNFTRGVDYKYTFYPKSTDGVVTYVKPTGLVYTEPTGYDTGKKDKYHIPLSLENGDKVIVRIGTDSKIKDTYENRILSKSVAKNAGMFKNLSMVSVSGDIDAVTINYFYQCDNSTVSGKKNIYYRPIDVNTPFPLNTDRTLSVEEQIEKVGSNWYSWYYGTEKSDNNTTNQQRISNSYNKTSSSEYYKVTLNRKSIVNIREYNQNYNDYLTTVTIDSDGSSSFITKFSDIFEISNAKYNEKGSFEEAKN